MLFGHLKRREVIALLGSAATWPLAARAATTSAQLVSVHLSVAHQQGNRSGELQEGLRELGYVAGQNIEFDFRSADGKADRLPALAAELVRLKVDVIVALYVPSALAAKQATQNIPIVIVAADPVEMGIVPVWRARTQTFPACR